VGYAAALLLIGIGAVIGILLVRPDGPQVEPAKLNAGWTRAAGPAFTLGLPPGWRSFPTTMDERDFAELEKTDPGRAAMLRGAFGGGLSPYIRFIALDAETPLSPAFTTNLTVIVVSAPRGLDAFVDNDVAQLRAADGVASTVQTQRISLPAAEAAIVTAQLRLVDNPELAVVTHYVLVANDVGFSLQFTTNADRLTELAPTFEEVARTFRFT
jgi:hypothetical protein